jgi:hypothetical protein
MKKLLVGLAATLVLVGCKSLSAPVEAAQTPEQTAYALYGTFVVFEELAASIVTDPATPASVKDVIKQADAVAKPAADGMIDAARQVIKIQTQLAAGTTPDEKLEIASTNLYGWTLEAKPKILALQCAVNPKQQACEKKE